VKKVAVVILNWNGEKFLRDFLPAVLEHSQADADVVVIDNASSDGSKALVEQQFPMVRWIALDRNYGFAGGYNRGLQHVENEYYILLNSDVEVTEGWIPPVIAYIESQPKMAACQPKILDYHRKGWFEYAGASGGYMDKDYYAFCAGRIFFAFEEDRGQYSGNTEVFWASGAAMFIRRSAWREVDGLDEDFFAHMEEIDLCWRLKNRGYAIGACRTSQVYHYGGGTLDRHSPFKTYLNFRNNLYMLLKNHRGSMLFLKVVRRLLLDGIAGCRFLLEGKPAHVWSVLKAHFSFYAKLGRMLSKRRSELQAEGTPNLNGLYQESIIKQFFLQKRRTFSELEKGRFVGSDE
jgi:GT2 family glycosyltransferase